MGRTIELYGFPFTISVSDVKEFVEKRTGEGTVDAIKVRQGKGRVPRAYAIIQFTTVENATYIISLAARTLWYGGSYLKARKMEKDIIQRPRTYLHNMDKVKLYFGCQLSKEKFSYLWKGVNVGVSFGKGMRKLHFFLSHGEVQYKLELSYENIWQIELHQPRGEYAKYLLIQVVYLTFRVGLWKFVLYFHDLIDSRCG